MPHYLINGRDKANSLDLRLKTRAAHLSWVADSPHTILMAGPVFSEHGETMAGSTFVIEADSLAAAKAWAEQDPYRQAGLFAQVEVIPFKWAIGTGLKTDG